MTKTGNALRTACLALTAVLGAAGAFHAGSARAAAGGGPQFTATVDRTEASMDESVSLKFSVQSEGGAQVGEPHFTAPDFDVVNEYTGTFVESYYDGNTGRFGMRNNQQITKVLKPKRTGQLRIYGLSIDAGGKRLTAPEISVMITGAGQGTPPPRGYGGTGLGLRGAGKPLSGASVKVRAEVDRTKAYKGEQIIVSYYLYRRVRVFNIQVDKFPILNGFLREDLEMPVLGQRLDTDRVILDGQPYERSLLMRYAAYPLQEGKLQIDSTTLKYAYYPSGNSLDDEDPLMGFFRQMNPQQGASTSEQVDIEVLPLPEQGKPASFTGGVGDFNLVSAVDKYDVKANEAVTLTLKVEGRGNLAAIGEPKAKWPDGVELYDSKGVAHAGAGGVGQKVFEFLLIPRVPGKLTLPPLELSFFDPTQSKYVTRTTEPIVINVGEPAAGSALVNPPKATGAQASAPSAAAAEPAGLKPPGDGDAPVSAIPAWRWLYWACLVAFAAFFGLVAYDFALKTQARSAAAAGERARVHARSWTRLQEGARGAVDGASWQDVVQTYELLAGVVFDAIDKAYDVGSRSRPRSQLKEILVDEKGLPPPAWERISRLLEYAEMVRFATSAGAISEKVARSELARWVSEGEAVSRILSSKSLAQPG